MKISFKLWFWVLFGKYWSLVQKCWLECGESNFWTKIRVSPQCVKLISRIFWSSLKLWKCHLFLTKTKCGRRHSLARIVCGFSEVVHFTHQCLLPRLERSKTNEGEGEVWDPNQMNNQKCYTTTTQFKAARFLYYTLKVASASTPLTQEQIPPSFLRVRV